MALRKVETCIIKATEMLDAADKIKDLPGPYSLRETDQRITETTELLKERLGASSEIVERATLKMRTLEHHDMQAAHDLITKAALEELVKCAAGDPEVCVAAGASIGQWHERYTEATPKDATTPIIYRTNVAGLVSNIDMRVPYSELALHTRAECKEIIAWLLFCNYAHVVYRDDKKGCDIVHGLPEEVMSEALIKRTRDMWPTPGCNEGPSSRKPMDKEEQAQWEKLFKK